MRLLAVVTLFDANGYDFVIAKRHVGALRSLKPNTLPYCLQTLFIRWS